MTNKIEISRELAERLIRAIDEPQPSPLYAELRKLLDANHSEEPTLAEHCKKCSDVVKAWPESKRDCLGKIAGHSEEPLGLVERHDGLVLMKIAADLANRNPLRQLYLVCEHQSRINTDILHDHLDKCGDLLAGIALDIRRAITSAPAPVAVALDENVEFEKWWCRTPVLRKGRLQIAQEAWEARARLDKVKELNQ